MLLGLKQDLPHTNWYCKSTRFNSLSKNKWLFPQFAQETIGFCRWLLRPSNYPFITCSFMLGRTSSLKKVNFLGFSCIKYTSLPRAEHTTSYYNKFNLLDFLWWYLWCRFPYNRYLKESKEAILFLLQRFSLTYGFFWKLMWKWWEYVARSKGIHHDNSATSKRKPVNGFTTCQIYHSILSPKFKRIIRISGCVRITQRWLEGTQWTQWMQWMQWTQ